MAQFEKRLARLVAASARCWPVIQSLPEDEFQALQFLLPTVLGRMTNSHPPLSEMTLVSLRRRRAEAKRRIENQATAYPSITNRTVLELFGKVDAWELKDLESEIQNREGAGNASAI